MAKLIATAEQIQAEIQRRISESTALDGDCRDCRAPSPVRLDPDENAECNWTVTVFPGVEPGCLDFVKAVTREVMREYDLA
ncbi:hypothetical protein M3I54_11870 [Paraburkholderia sp. CNPSo 3274]|uniref:hypothetical protein n=1 Tax=Paraburkholderia sp. CNPSo 3274 TaxID=2940932 RepID=UPI0020B8EB0C|nr:hypothetical protein [Paraburkholderia sp. CNPSo 3274]MCP3707675.1 hypothetical protein [Paraburkholderia sp. CNPSo 3274]